MKILQDPIVMISMNNEYDNQRQFVLGQMNQSFVIAATASLEHCDEDIMSDYRLYESEYSIVSEDLLGRLQTSSKKIKPNVQTYSQERLIELKQNLFESNEDTLFQNLPKLPSRIP